MRGSEMDHVFFPAIIFAVLLGLATLGAGFLVMDFRLFNDVVAQCERQGYIQNTTTRIFCSKEK